MHERGPQPQTKYSGPDCKLPSGLKPIAVLDSQPGPNLQTFDEVILSSLDAAEVGEFRRQAQSISLLDRLLLVMRLTTVGKETKLAELAELDSKIRSFLEVVMGELDWRQTLICGHVALCIR